MDPLTAAGQALGRELSTVDGLRGSDRSSVVRATVDGGPETVIVKAHDRVYTDHWQRESAALAILRGRGLPVPELLATVDDPPLVVLSDAGSGPNLADALLHGTALEATTRLNAWADTLAALHAGTADDADLFAETLGTAVDPMPLLLDAAADMLVAELPALGLTPDARALHDLRAVGTRFTTNAEALTPADACPDNNVLTPEGLVLLDFEQACFRHVAWDVAYLIVPWPSCWCSWDLPPRTASAAVRRWRTAVAREIPSVGGEDFDRDLDLAVVAWSVMSSAWFLAGAIQEEQEPPGGGDLPGPTRRAVIRKRMRLVTERPTISDALTQLADDVLTATEDRWSGHHLDVAPAFRRIEIYREA